jgi:hypothetical protein
MKSYQAELVVIMDAGDLVDKVKDGETHWVHNIKSKDAVLTSFELLNEAENRDDFHEIFDDLEKYNPSFQGFILIVRPDLGLAKE